MRRPPTLPAICHGGWSHVPASHAPMSPSPVAVFPEDMRLSHPEKRGAHSRGPNLHSRRASKAQWREKALGLGMPERETAVTADPWGWTCRSSMPRGAGPDSRTKTAQPEEAPHRPRAPAGDKSCWPAFWHQRSHDTRWALGLPGVSQRRATASSKEPTKWACGRPQRHLLAPSGNNTNSL